MPVTICFDTRNLSPENAKKIWWEISISIAPATARGRALGFDKYVYTVNGLCLGHNQAAEHLVELDKSFKTADEAVQFSEKQAREIGLPCLHGIAAAAERSRVWRVG